MTFPLKSYIDPVEVFQSLVLAVGKGCLIPAWAIFRFAPYRNGYLNISRSSEAKEANLLVPGRCITFAGLGLQIHHHQQVVEARVVAEGVRPWIYLEKNQAGLMFLVGYLQPFKRLVLFTSSFVLRATAGSRKLAVALSANPSIVILPES